MSGNSRVEVAAILAGGKGTRLASVVPDTPKPVAPIGEKPFLFYVFEDLARIGIRDVVLLTGYHHEKVVEQCRSAETLGLSVHYSRETEPLGTGGALRQAIETSPFLKKPFLLLNGDTVIEPTVKPLLDHTLEKEEVILMGIMEVEDRSRFGGVELRGAGPRIERFLEKGASDPGWVNSGAYLVSPRILEFTPQRPAFLSLENEVLPRLLREEIPIRGVPLPGRFHDIGVPESYWAFHEIKAIK